MHRQNDRLRIAVIGTGIAGMSAAWLLNQAHHVTVYKQASRVGGHSNTVDVTCASGTTPVDMGFIVYNPATYPNLVALFRHRLRLGGVIVLQTITISDQQFPSYRRSSDFIQRYIFPGGMLPSPTALRAQIARAGLVIHNVETFGASYAQTLKLWQARFQAAWPEIAASGFSARFRLMWEYYLSYCEAGFRAGAIDVGLWRLGRRC